MKILWILLLFLPKLILAQSTPEHFQYTVEDGLPSMECYDITQDNQGYIWIGTDHGLVKFNGKKFEAFTTDDGLPTNVVFKFYPDASGRIWCSGKDKNIFYIENGNIQNYKYNQRLKDSINHVFADLKLHFSTTTKSLMAIASHEIVSVDSLGKLQRIPSNLYTPKNKDKVIDVLRGFRKENSFFVIRNWKTFDSIYDQNPDGIDFIDIPTHSYQSLQYATLVDNVGFGIAQNKLIRFSKHDLKQFEFDRFLISIKPALNGKDIWLGLMGGGAILVDQNGNIKDHILKNLSVSSIFFDQNENMWASTLENGIVMIPKPKIVALPLKSSGQICDLNTFNNEVYGLTRDGTFLKFNGRTTSNQKQLETKGVSFYINIVETQEGKVEAIKKLLTSSPKATYLYSYNSKHNQQKQVGIGGPTIYYFDEKGEQTHKKQGNYRINDFDFLKDSEILGTSRGVWISSGKQAPLIQLAIPEINNESINQVISYKHGFFAFVRSLGVIYIEDIKSLKTNWVFKSSSISRIKVVNDNLWAISKNAVIKINLNHSETYTPDYFSTPIPSLTHITMNDEHLYLANSNTFFVIDQKDISFQKTLPNFQITSIRSSLGQKTVNDKILLDHNENQLEILFDVLDYNNPQEKAIRYRIAENDNWIHTSQHSIQLTGLAYGTHQLVIEVTDNIGQWHFVKEIEFVVATPFWKTVWFYLIITVSFILIVFLVARSIVHRKALKAKTAALELSVITQQINPHFIFNSLNSIRGFIYKNKFDQADDYLIRFSKLTRKILAISRESETTVEDEMDVLQDYLELEKMRSGNRFNFSITLEGTEDELAPIPSLLTQPFVENAVIHGVLPLTDRDGIIHVRFIIHEVGVTIEIEDNGIGRQSSRNHYGHKSMGTDIVKDRLALFDENSSFEIQDLKREDGTPTGTLVIIKLSK